MITSLMPAGLRGARTLTADPAFWPRAAILVGVSATITMNITAGLGYGPGAAVLASLIPVVFVIALESFVVVIRNCGWPWWIGAGLVLVPAAGIAGWVSWLHGHQVCLWTHNPDPQARLIPFLPDLLIVCGSVALVALKVAAKNSKNRAGSAPRPQPSPPPDPGHPSKPRQPKTRQAPPGQSRDVLSPKVLAHLSPAQIKAEEEAALDIAGLADLPSQREIAVTYFGGNRPAAKRTLARAAIIRGGEPQPAHAMNGYRKD
jgi:hypothetical protein